ncbi:MAG: hypothetical protein QXO74_02935 [Candidatus Methanomethylicia archaeon]
MIKKETLIKSLCIAILTEVIVSLGMLQIIIAGQIYNLQKEAGLG